MDISEYRKNMLLVCYNAYKDGHIPEDSAFVVSGLVDQIEKDLDLDKTLEWVEAKYDEAMSLSYMYLRYLSLNSKLKYFSRMSCFPSFVGEESEASFENFKDLSLDMYQVIAEEYFKENCG